MNPPMYTPLLPEAKQIRLLRLLPGSTATEAAGGEGSATTGQPCLEMSVHELDQAPAYTALSYTWGTAEAKDVISVNGSGLPVRPNLYAALQSFARLGDTSSHLWADAICINQGDLRDKQHQVSIMGDIFRSASRTVIWLGPASADSDLAMDTLASLAAEDMVEPRCSELAASWRGVTALLQRGWFSRLWVLQEAYLSRQPVARCGDREIPFERFVVLKELYEEAWWRDEGRWREMHLFQGVPFTSCLSNWAVTKSQIAGGGASVFDWLSTLSTRLECSLPRDKVYGVLGMSLPADRETIAPDYSRPMREILIDVAVRGLFQLGFFILGFARPVDDETPSPPVPGLPSWVPDLTVYSSQVHMESKGDNAGLTPLDPAWDTIFAASNLSPEDAQMVYGADREREIMAVYGVLVDIVTFADAMATVPVYLGVDPAEADANKDARYRATVETYKRWEPLVLGAPDSFPDAQDAYADAPGGRLNAFWRTIVCDSRVKGERPLPEDFADRYEALVGRRAPPGEEGSGSAITDDPARARQHDWIRPFAIPAVSKGHNKALIMTLNGRVGLTIRGVQPLDLVVVARGANMPFIFRKLPDWGYRFMGQAYVHGIMDGEAVAEAVEKGRGMIKLLVR